MFDSGGNQTVATAGIVVTGQQKPGLFTLSYVDLNVAAAGIPLTVTRTYDSRDKTQGDFGVGWRLGLNTMRVSPSTMLGSSWRVTAAARAMHWSRTRHTRSQSRSRTGAYRRSIL